MFTSDDHAFVVCAYGENPFVESTIESLERQSVPTLIKLSTSTPSSYLQDICRRHDIEMLVNPEKRGAAADWNYAVSHAGADLVTLAHQDDVYESGYAQSVIDVANRYPSEEIQLVFTDYYELRDGARVDRNRLLNIKRIMNLPFRSRLLSGSPWVKKRVLAFGDSICCPAVTINRRVVQDPVFNLEYVNSCDYKTWVDLAAQKGRFVYIPQRLMGHRIYEGSATTKNLEDNVRQREDLEILSSLWPSFIAHLIYRLYATGEKSNNL